MALLSLWRTVMETKTGLPAPVKQKIFTDSHFRMLLLGWLSWDSAEILGTEWVEMAPPARLLPFLLHHVLHNTMWGQELERTS